jgi:hypothetical protein
LLPILDFGLTIVLEIVNPKSKIVNFLKNMRKIILLLIFTTEILRGYAQDKIIITKNFKFNDGIYTSFAHIQKNKPDWAWESVETNLVTSTQSLQTQIEYIRSKKTKQDMPIDSIWGVVIDGIPYIRLPKEYQKKTLPVFSGLVLRGKICYFQFDDIEEKKIPMTVYIPETGQEYATKKVSQKHEVKREKLLLFASGDIIDCSLQNVKTQIADDKDLLSTVNNLNQKEIQEKLFKCLLIYNDRNPTFIKAE